MGTVSWSLTFCPLIQIYTAHSEEHQALERRRFRLNMTQRQIFDYDNETFMTAAPNDWVKLNNKVAILVFEKIVLAQEVHDGPIVSYKRKTLNMVEDRTLDFSYQDMNDIRKGVKLTFLTSGGSLTIKVIAFMDSWRIAKILLNGNTTFRPRDLLVYSNKYSLCCRVITVYSVSGTRLSLYMFHLDVTIDGKLNYDGLRHSIK